MFADYVSVNQLASRRILFSHLACTIVSVSVSVLLCLLSCGASDVSEPFLFIMMTSQFAYVENSCVGRYSGVDKLYATIGVTDKTQGLLVIGHKEKLGAGVEGGPRNESFDICIFDTLVDAEMASGRILTCFTSEELEKELVDLPGLFKLKFFGGVTSMDIQKVCKVGPLKVKWPAHVVAGGVQHPTLGKRGLLELTIIDENNMQRSCAVECVCVGVSLEGAGAAKIQYVRGGVVKVLYMDLDTATQSFASRANLAVDAPHFLLGQVAPLMSLLLSNLPENRGVETTSVSSLEDLMTHTPLCQPAAEFRSMLPMEGKNLDVAQVNQVAAEMGLAGERFLLRAVRHKIPVPDSENTDTIPKLHTRFRALVEAVLAAEVEHSNALREARDSAARAAAQVEAATNPMQQGMAGHVHWSSTAAGAPAQSWRRPRAANPAANLQPTLDR